ncbi:hypothetical protein [Calycomorphotria hydatis]|uniref:Uncharacterized protein n=1 Tax=Calycomorphotria hydatis TaxID=2528027 RepID=A0A517T3K0_9PLAN|nr:hypothetical protein [Calycomorphotria hydatis]QDT62953.1 hypothetical protein V22_01510 [Calycomorphotria hydatis]
MAASTPHIPVADLGPASAVNAQQHDADDALSIPELIAETGKLPWDAALECVQQVAECLANSNDENEDAPARLKAEHVRVDEDGTVRLSFNGLPRAACGPALVRLLDECAGSFDDCPVRLQPLVDRFDELAAEADSIPAYRNLARLIQRGLAGELSAAELATSTKDDSSDGPSPGVVMGVLALLGTLAAIAIWQVM